MSSCGHLRPLHRFIIQQRFDDAKLRILPIAVSDLPNRVDRYAGAFPYEIPRGTDGAETLLKISEDVHGNGYCSHGREDVKKFLSHPWAWQSSIIRNDER